MLPNGFIKPVEDTVLQAVVESIGVYFSSGDNGDESQVRLSDSGLARLQSLHHCRRWHNPGCGKRKQLSVRNWLGRHHFNLDRHSLVTQTAGHMVLRRCQPDLTEPSYQVGVVPQSVFTAQGRTGRAVPDVSANADPNTGYLICETQTFPDGSVRYAEYRIGGTSLSCPLVVGMMALADQAAGIQHGFANPVFYSHAGAFRDVVSPSSTVAVVRINYVNSVDATDGLSFVLRTANQTLSLHTTPGYDDVTGLGSPTAGILNLP